jgi:hypothetical protein
MQCACLAAEGPRPDNATTQEHRLDTVRLICDHPFGLGLKFTMPPKDVERRNVADAGLRTPTPGAKFRHG